MGDFAHYKLPKQIVMVSTADWDAPLWTNKQQIASRLAGDFEVLYVEPLNPIGSGKRGVAPQHWRDPSGVTIFRPGGSLPFGNKLWPVNEANCMMVARNVRQVMEELGFFEPVLWCYPPTSRPFLDAVPHAIACYDCVDEYSAFPGAWITTTRKMERQLVKGADAVFTTARSLYEDKKKFNKHTYFVPNVADFEHFNQATTAVPSRLVADLPRPILGFVGALNYKIDNDLLDELLELRPDWSFVFVGPDRGMGTDRFIGKSNMHFLGRRKIAELPPIMAAFDVCIIPYLVNRYTRGVLPLKFFEYLATGKPVITSPLPELNRFQPMIDIAPSAEALVRAVERRMTEDPHREQRIAQAKENSWEQRINQMLSILEKIHRAKTEEDIL